MKNARKLTEGAILLAVFIVLLLVTIYIPLIGAFLNLALPIPFILYGAKNDWKSTVIFVIASLLFTLLTGAIITFPLVVPYILTGAVMGFLIQKNKSRTTILMFCSLVFLLNIVALYVVSIRFFHFNFIDELMKTMRESLAQSESLMKKFGTEKQSGQTVKTFEQGLDLIKKIVPSLFVLISLTYVFVIQLVSLPVLKRFGINVGNWKPFREISMPKSLLWYYLIVMGATLIFHPASGTYWNDALMNLTYILQMFMLFQGLTFIYFYFHQRNASKSVPIIITVLMFLFPLLLYAVGILGIIDLGFGLRKHSDNIK